MTGHNLERSFVADTLGSHSGGLSAPAPRSRPAQGASQLGSGRCCNQSPSGRIVARLVLSAISHWHGSWPGPPQAGSIASFTQASVPEVNLSSAPQHTHSRSQPCEQPSSLSLCSAPQRVGGLLVVSHLDRGPPPTALGLGGSSCCRQGAHAARSVPAVLPAGPGDRVCNSAPQPKLGGGLDHCHDPGVGHIALSHGPGT